MSIEKIDMWCATCDNCKDNYELYDGCIALNEKNAIEDDIKDAGEWVILEDGKTYCPDCHQTQWDEEADENLAFTKDTEHSSTQLLGTIK